MVSRAHTARTSNIVNFSLISSLPQHNATGGACLSTTGHVFPAFSCQVVSVSTPPGTLLLFDEHNAYRTVAKGVIENVGVDLIRPGREVGQLLVQLMVVVRFLYESAVIDAGGTCRDSPVIGIIGTGRPPVI